VQRGAVEKCSFGVSRNLLWVAGCSKAGGLPLVGHPETKATEKIHGERQREWGAGSRV